MRPLTFMIVAGEASGDLLAAELVPALRSKVIQLAQQPTSDVQPRRTPLEPLFFGAGGPRMAAAGVELAAHLTQHAVVGLAEPLRRLRLFGKLLRQLVRLAVQRKPDAIVCVDFFGFNHRLARAIRRYVRNRLSWFQPWNPVIIQYVSPQVWASRPGRVRRLAADYDLVLSILPFEKAWYAAHAPEVKIEFVGHPVLDRLAQAGMLAWPAAEPRTETDEPPQVVLLPGSRIDELRRHVPVMLGAFELIRSHLRGCAAKMVLPDETLAAQARSLGVPEHVELVHDGLYQALSRATIAIAKSGTVTLECAVLGVPTVVIYKTSWPTYLVAKQFVKVKHLAMPNLLAGEELMPELIQAAATPANVARAALELLNDPARLRALRKKLSQLTAQLGGPGVADRAATAITDLLK
ncbi:MAG: lipid-A-disaccharide synthase [Verrucomicrobiales bacterium]|nr:lipid-A-disaccharide synthase [Verrucomicrobiales bacterium]